MNFDEQDYSKRFDAGLWVRIFKLISVFKKELFILLLMMVLCATVDAVFPLMSRYAIDHFIGRGDLTGFPWFVVGYVALVLFQASNIYIFIRNSGKIECGVTYHIRKVGFNRLQELSFSYFDKTPVGWIMARMTSDAQRIGDVIAWAMLDLIWSIAIIIIVIITMLLLNLKLALITICTFPILIGVSLFFQKVILKSHREVRKINSKITGAYNEGINGARTTKSLNREAENFAEFSELTVGMEKASVKAAIISAIYLPIVISLGSVGVGLVLWLGGVDVAGGVITFGTYSAFLSYAMQVFEPVQQIARVFSEFQSAQASAERTLSLIETEPEIADRPDVVAKYGDNINPKKENWPAINGDITFDHVTFAYTKADEKDEKSTIVLDDFYLDVKAGEKIALVGETGAGKSTIVNLLCRFYEPTNGTIYIDGVDYRERSQIWLQANLGYVLQSPHLFSGTIADNIRYAKLDATMDEIVAAAKTVKAYDFIMKLDKGFDTEVGEGGSRLSAGQKQLISFARAIIGNPRIFVLDEATSSIDTETEQMLQNAVDIVLKGRTSFIVAHRLSTIRSCDRILVIKEGKIAECGSHKELIRKKGHYYNLYTHQFMSEAEERILSLKDA